MIYFIFLTIKVYFNRSYKFQTVIRIHSILMDEYNTGNIGNTVLFQVITTIENVICRVCVYFLVKKIVT